MPLKTTVIGAFPKPDYLHIPDWFKTGQSDYVSSAYDSHVEKQKEEELRSLFDKATEDVIRLEESIGLDVLTDGEIGRDNYIYHFCRRVSGFDFGKLTLKACRNGAYSCELPTITGELEPCADAWVAEEWRRAQALTASPVKMTLPGPMTIIDTTYNAFYKSTKELSLALVKCINDQVRSLALAGCKQIQIDEPLMVRDPATALDHGIQHLEQCFQGVGPDVQKIVHLCCGYPRYIDDVEYPKADRHCYHLIADRLDAALFDAVSIEDAHRHNDLDLFSHFKQTTVILGVVAIATSKVETRDEIQKRVSEVLSVVPPERLLLAPDCGLGFLPPDTLRQKLTNMVAVAQSFS